MVCEAPLGSEKYAGPRSPFMIEQIKNKHLLIDGDIIKYRCAASAEKTKYLVECIYEDGYVECIHCESSKEAKEVSEKFKASTEYKAKEFVIWNRKEVQPVEFALQACKTTLEALSVRLEPSAVSIYLSPERTFRQQLACTKPYKGNRTAPKPKYLKDVEDYLVSNHAAVYGINVEADDEIGVALSDDPAGRVSVSIDKDLLQVPGWHYNWVSNTVRRISPREGDFNFYTQMLTGDATDNIPGLPGIGEAKAATLLDGARSRAELATRVWNAYRGQFNDTLSARIYFMEQAELLWIRRKAGITYSCPIELV